MIRSDTRRLSRAATIAALLAACAMAPCKLASAQDSVAPLIPRITAVPAPRDVLFVGNSFTYYNGGLFLHLAKLAESAPAQRSLRYEHATKGGAALHELQEPFEAALAKRRYDLVVLQGFGTEPIEANAGRFERTVQEYDRYVRGNGARTVLFMTWAYGNRPQMGPALDKAYTRLGNDLGALVVPVGLAFERARVSRPALAMHAPDKVHSSHAGTYLATCTFYAALYGESPVGNPYIYDLPAEDARFLQEVAWETVRAYYGTGAGSPP